MPAFTITALLLDRLHFLWVPAWGRTHAGPVDWSAFERTYAVTRGGAR